MSQISIASFFRGYLGITDCVIDEMILKDSLFQAYSSEFALESISVTGISRNINSTARLFTVESSSTVNVSNVDVRHVGFSILSVTDSSFQIYDSYIENITASQFVIECYSSDNLIFQNLTIHDSETVDRIGMMNFRN